MRRFILNITIFVAPIIVLSVLISCYGVYRNDNDAIKAAQDVAEGKSVTYINKNERLFHKAYIETPKSVKPDILALGNSRAQYISSSMVDSSGQYSFFNSSMGGAAIEEVMAVYNLWSKKDSSKIKQVIIEVAPVWFDVEYKSYANWKPLYANYCELYELLTNKETSIEYDDYADFDRLFSMRALKNNFKTMFFSTYQVVDSSYRKDFYRNSEGVKAGSFYEDRVGKLRLIPAFTKYYSFTNISASNTDLFVKFVEHILNDGSNICFLFNAFSPTIYDWMLDNGTPIMQIENFVQEYWKSNANVTFKGSYNPYVNNFTDDDFVDPVHPKASTYKKLLQTHNL